MKKNRFLLLGILLSALIHVTLAASFFHVSRSHIFEKTYKDSRFVQVNIKKPEPKPKPKPKPKKAVKKKIKQAPVSHVKKEPEKQEEEVKPVFGVTKKTVEKDKPTKGIGVRVGNTLMKEMEKEYTPPDKVKDYSAGKNLEERDTDADKFSPVPVTELASMPRAINPVKPKYPDELEEDEIEGEVILELSISKKGKVISVKVIESEHPLFAKAAVKTAKRYKLIPGKTKDGKPVDAIIEYTFVFEIPL